MSSVTEAFKKDFGRLKDKAYREKLLRVVTIAFMALYCLALAAYTRGASVIYAEIDSYALPAISIQYRGSLTMNESDLVRAQQDFPEIYREDCNTYEDLHCNKLIRTTDDPNTWISYYFPVYSIVCLPMKLLFQLVGAPQVYSFSAMNVTLVYAALLLSYKALKIPPGRKLLLLMCMFICPIFQYCPFISAEAMIYSFVVMALALYHEKHYRTAGLLVTAAGMANPVIMLFGAVMIVNYLVDILSQARGMTVGGFIKKHFLNTLILALCYVPSFIPFIFNSIYSGKLNTTFGMFDLSGLIARFLTYLFDTNLGFATFAGLLVLLAIVAFPLLIYRKRWDSLYYYAALFLTVLGFSCATNINCGMVLCARYVIWSYPMLAYIAILFVPEIFRRTWLREAVQLISIASVGVTLLINSRGSMGAFENYTANNTLTQTVVDLFPQLYAPLTSTFYNRAMHIDGGYTLKESAAFFDSSSGEVRKLVVYGSGAGKHDAALYFRCSKGDPQDFADLIASVPEDGKYHYLNIGRWSSFQVKHADAEQSGALKPGRIVYYEERTEHAFSPEKWLLDISFETKPYQFYKITFRTDAGADGLLRSAKLMETASEASTPMQYDPDTDTYYGTIMSYSTQYTGSIAEVSIVCEADGDVSLTELQVTEMEPTRETNIMMSSGDGSSFNKLWIIPMETDTEYELVIDCSDYDTSADGSVYIGHLWEEVSGFSDTELKPGENIIRFNSNIMSPGSIPLTVTADTSSPVYISRPYLRLAGSE